MKDVKVVNLSAAARRLYQRLPENSNGIPVKIGWDGQQIAVYAGTYAEPAKSLPNERIHVEPWRTIDEIESLLIATVAGMRKAMATALSGRGSSRAPRRNHQWRRGAIDHG